MIEILLVSIVLFFFLGLPWLLYLLYNIDKRQIAAFVQKSGGLLKGGAGEFFKDKVGVRVSFLKYPDGEYIFEYSCLFKIQVNLIFQSNYFLINTKDVIIGDKLVGSVNNYRLFKSCFSKSNQQFEQDLLRVLAKIKKIAPGPFSCRLSKTETFISFCDSDIESLAWDDALDYTFELFLNIKSISSSMIEYVDFKRVQRNTLCKGLCMFIGVILSLIGFVTILSFIVKTYVD